MSFLTELSLKRRSVALLVAIGIVVGGLLAATQLKTELIPDIEFPTLTIVTYYPGAGPEDVVEQVAKPLEQAISGTPGLTNLQSISGEGSSVIIAEFNYGTRMKEAEDAINAKVRAANLPQGASTPKIARFSMQMLPLVQLSLSGEKDVSEIERVAREQLLPELLAIDGVYAVDLNGGAQKQVDIVLDPAKMRQAGVSAQQVAQVIKANNIAAPSGSVTAQGRTLNVRTIHEYTSLAELQNAVVGVSMPKVDASSAAGLGAGDSASQPVPVLLKDIATVSLTNKASSGIARANGHPAVGITISKVQEANTVQVANAVMAKVHEVEKNLPAGLQITPVMNQADYIQQSVNGLLRDGLLGAVFAVVVIFIFLTSVRSSLVTAVSIPLSVLTALILLRWWGLTLNIMTLGGLAIAIGRVVDDAIVVLENIYRHVRQGEEIGVAARTGTKEVASAITSSTLTTICVFLPLGLVGGLVSELFLPFALAVTFAMIASLLIALTVVPVLAYFFIGHGLVGKTQGETWLQRIYGPLLGWALRHRIATLGIALVLFAASFGLVPFIPVTFLPSMQEKSFQISLVLPAGADDATVLAKIQEVEKVLGQTKGVKSYMATSGGSGALYTMASAVSGRSLRSATFAVRLNSDADLEATAQTVREGTAGIQGAFSVVSIPQAAMTSRLQVVASGNDLKQVQAASQQILNAIKGTEGLSNLSSDVDTPRPEIEVKVDANKAALAGLTTAQVASAISQMTSGQTVTQMRLDGGEPMDVQLSMAPMDATSLDVLLSAPDGKSVPLWTIAEIALGNGPTQITRVNQSPAATITGDLSGKNTGAVSNKIQRQIRDLQLPAGVQTSFGGVISQMRDSFYWMGVAIVIAVFLVYIVMVLVFGSLLDPFVILFSLPFASIGMLLALFITGRSLGMSALIGALMLVGIVVTNAIVLIDFVEQLIAKGYSVQDALIQGGKLRVRPILMTAVATILALLPVSLGFSEGAVIATELGTVVIGGLITSTMLTLIVVPVVYSMLESLKLRWGRKQEEGRPTTSTPQPLTDVEGS